MVVFCFSCFMFSFYPSFYIHVHRTQTHTHIRERADSLHLPKSIYILDREFQFKTRSIHGAISSAVVVVVVVDAFFPSYGTGMIFSWETHIGVFTTHTHLIQSGIIWHMTYQIRTPLKFKMWVFSAGVQHHCVAGHGTSHNWGHVSLQLQIWWFLLDVARTIRRRKTLMVALTPGSSSTSCESGQCQSRLTL